MKATIRLLSRTVPIVLFLAYMLLSFVILFSVMSLVVKTLGILFILTAAFGLFIFWLYFRIMRNGIRDELKDRKGSPIRVFRPGRRPYRLHEGSGWWNHPTSPFTIVVNPRPGHFTFMKNWYLVDVGSTNLDEALLNIAANCSEAAVEVKKTLDTRKHFARSASLNSSQAVSSAESVVELLN